MPGSTLTASPHRITRAATLPLLLLTVAAVLFIASLVDAAWRGSAADLTGSQSLVTELGLTDLALFTEARYTRHLSQADRHTAFQDHPLALDHFPSGSLVPPPARLRQP